MDRAERHGHEEHALARALNRVADELAADRKHHRREPAWARRVEGKVADLAQAVTDLQAASANDTAVLQTVVDELRKLADEVRAAGSTQAAADAIEAEVAKLTANQAALGQAVTDAEQPAPPPEPTP